MIIFGNQSQIKEKKKLNIRKLNAQSPTINKKFLRPQQKDQRLVRSHSLAKNQNLMGKIEQNETEEIFQRKRSSRRLTEVSKDIKLFTKSLEKQNNKKMVINRKNRIDKNLRISQPFSIIRNEGKRLSLFPKSSYDKPEFNVIELLNFCENNLVDENREEKQQLDFTENSQKQETIKRYHRQCTKIEEYNTNSYQDKCQCLEHDNLQQNSKEGDSAKFSSQTINLILSSKVTQIMIPPWNKKGQKVNQQAQTVQSQTQYFEYLVYKRKKQQYENELMELFSDISQVKQDRKQFLERKDSIFEIYNQEPQDQRQKRIFQLKKDIDRLQQTVQTSLNETLKKEEIQLKQVQQIQMRTLSGLTKVEETIRNYLSVFKQVFQKFEDPKYLRIVDRLQNLISNILNEVNKQINYHIKKGKVYKQQSTEFKHIFNEFIDTNHQYKKLLRNCFQYLKKTPELCYELFGEKSPQININLDLQNENNEFQKPKCVHCFNSKWKLHTIVQQNILMKSVLKVSEQLLK